MLHVSLCFHQMHGEITLVGCELSFAVILRATHLCLRGSQTKWRSYSENSDDAAWGRLKLIDHTISH